MKGLIAFLLMTLLALNAYNYWQIRQLRTQVAALQSRSIAAPDAFSSAALMEQAMPLLDQARTAVQHADFEKAKRLLSELNANLGQVNRFVDHKALPGIDWIHRQAHSLQDQIQQK